jgi:hypothetical protein
VTQFEKRLEGVILLAYSTLVQNLQAVPSTFLISRLRRYLTGAEALRREARCRLPGKEFCGLRGPAKRTLHAHIIIFFFFFFFINSPTCIHFNQMTPAKVTAPKGTATDAAVSSAFGVCSTFN